MMDVFYREFVRRLPISLQGIILDPPSLSNPSSFIPVIKALIPYTQYIIVLIAFYIVWSVLSGLFGYFSRFLRFAFKIGPIIGIIGWILAASGQGSLGDMLEMAKQYAGIVPGNNPGDLAPGLAQLAGLFGGDRKTSSKKSKRNKPASSSWGPFSTDSDPISSRTRKSKAKTPDSKPDILSSILESAAGLGRGEQAEGIQGYVQDYVKKSLAKAAGLEWLLGSEKAEEKRSTR